MRRSRRERRRERATLRALTSSALALLGAASKASADTAMDVYESSYSFSTYSEDDLDASKTIPGAERKRYEITTQQAALAGPLTDWLDLSLEVTHEKMSGASPWYTVQDAAGSPIQFMSEATIEDTRNDINVHTSYYTERGRVGFGGGYSTENDYTAINFGTDGEMNFNEKNTTLSGGLGLSFDTIEPVDTDTNLLRPTERDKQSYSGFVGLSQVINRRSVIQGSFSYNWGRGYLSDPYKEVYRIDGTHFADDRPNTRHQFAFLARYNRHIEETESTIHLSYQYYIDTWGLSSHTAELEWYQDFGDSLQISPHVRYYSQSAADFYVAYLPAGSPKLGDQSSDYRLSAFGALSFGLRAEYAFHTSLWRDIEWRPNLSVERYLSSGDLSLSSPSVEAPGLVSFTVLSVGLTAKF
jgi:hypothetical protein